MEKEYKTQRDALELQVEQLTEKANESELKYKLLKSEVDKEREDIRGTMDHLETQR